MTAPITVAGLSIDTSDLSRASNEADSAFKRIGASMDGMSESTRRASESMSGMEGYLERWAARFVVFETARAVFDDFKESLVEAEQASNRMTAVLHATGEAAGVSASQIEALSQRLSANSVYSEDQVKNASATMLVFGNVSKEQFGRAMQAATDMSAVMGGDLNSSVMALGRALENPIGGMMMLRREGIIFTEQEKEQIKTLMDHNQLLEAQNLILGKVESTMKGAAEQMTVGLGGALHQLHDALKLAESGFMEDVMALTHIDTLIHSIASGVKLVADNAAMDRTLDADLRSSDPKVAADARRRQLGQEQIYIQNLHDHPLETFIGGFDQNTANQAWKDIGPNSSFMSTDQMLAAINAHYGEMPGGMQLTAPPKPLTAAQAAQLHIAPAPVPLGAEEQKQINDRMKGLQEKLAQERLGPEAYEYWLNHRTDDGRNYTRGELDQTQALITLVGPYDAKPKGTPQDQEQQEQSGIDALKHMSLATSGVGLSALDVSMAQGEGADYAKKIQDRKRIIDMMAGGTDVANEPGFGTHFESNFDGGQMSGPSGVAYERQSAGAVMARSQKDLDEQFARILKANEEAAKQAAEPWKQFASGLDSILTNAFEGKIKSFKDFGDDLLRMMDEIIAKLLAKKIILGVIEPVLVGKDGNGGLFGGSSLGNDIFSGFNQLFGGGGGLPPGTDKLPSGSGTGTYKGPAPMVVHLTMPITVQALDGATAQEAMNRLAPAIQSNVIAGLTRSRAMVSALSARQG